MWTKVAVKFLGVVLLVGGLSLGSEGMMCRATATESHNRHHLEQQIQALKRRIKKEHHKKHHLLQQLHHLEQKLKHSR